MHCFIMKARTLDNIWYPFSIEDVPTRFNEDEFALMLKPNSPRLIMNQIRRGDAETGLFEGDIIHMEGEDWVVCYQRGFYVINELYITRFFSTLTDYEVIGDIFTRKFNITVLLRNKQLFKYNDNVFRLEDILGPDGSSNLILRNMNKPIPIKKIQQECGASYNDNKLFFGDMIEGSQVCLHDGRICLHKNNEYKDITAGGKL